MEKLVIAGREFNSRLFLGTGKFNNNALMAEAIKASETEMVTVAMKRIELEDCITARDLADKQTAFLRAQMEGVTFSTYESILYELSEVAGTPSFKQISAIIKA